MDFTHQKTISEQLLELDKSMNIEDNLLGIMERVQINECSIQQLLEIISTVIINKIDILNFLSVNAFNRGVYDIIIPLLQNALEYDPLHKDTLINLSEVLMEFGEIELAIKYINQVTDKSQEVVELVNKLTALNKSEKTSTNDILDYEQNDVLFTGERLVINQQVKENYNDVMQEHIRRYELASKYVEGKLVLDAACGAGYGTKMLQKAGAAYVIGVDVDKESLELAQKVYSDYNTSFIYGDVNKLIFENESFDVVVSFETIEHIEIGANWIKESARVLKDGGMFIVSTPNRKITNPGSYFVEQPMNFHHRFEYGVGEFVGELLKEYNILELYGQTFLDDKITYYSTVMREVRHLDRNALPYQNPVQKDHMLVSLGDIKDAEPMYVVAVCEKNSKKL